MRASPTGIWRALNFCEIECKNLKNRIAVFKATMLISILKFIFFCPLFISEFECRQWSFVLLPDRPKRLIGHTCCFKSLINVFSPIALNFMPLVAFSRPLCDLPLRGSRRATF